MPPEEKAPPAEADAEEKKPAPAEDEKPAEDAGEETDAEIAIMVVMALTDALTEKGFPPGLKSISFEGLDGDAPKVVAKGSGEPVEIEISGDELTRRVGEMADSGKEESE